MSRGKGIDLLLVHPGNRAMVYQSLGAELAAIEPPAWAAMMATFVRNNGYSVAVLDTEADGLDSKQAADEILDIDPLLTAIVVYGHQPSASTQNMPAASDIVNALKDRDPLTNTLLVGGHVAALPERTLREERADFVAGGEGPYTVLELLQALKSGGSDLSKVKGLWYWESGFVKANPPAPLVRDLDREIPELAWDLVSVPKYRAHNWHCFGGLPRQPYAALYTTLGCPYNCSFCCIQAPFKSGEALAGFNSSVNTYRFWSPGSVVGQIDMLVENYGVRNLRILDEMFVLNKRHVHGICDLIIERGHDLNMWAYARIDTVEDDLTLEKLKRAGVNWLCFGIESADETVRDDVRKGYQQEEIFNTMARVNSAGIKVIGNYIFGLPEDDLASMQSTLDLAMELNSEFANFYSAMAYPGASLYDTAVRNQWSLPEKWSGYSQHSVDTLPLPTNHLTSSEVLRFRDKAWQTYFSAPEYLEMISRKFGNQTVKEIQEMASHTLVRTYAE